MVDSRFDEILEDSRLYNRNQINGIYCLGSITLEVLYHINSFTRSIQALLGFF